MFWRIAAHEIKYRFRQGWTHIYFLILLALSYLFVNAAGGAFGDSITIAGSGPNSIINSPYAVTITIAVLGLLGVIITAAFMGQAIYRDYDSGIDPLMFTMPVRKVDFLGGRFVGALVVNFYIFTSLALGLMAGEITPWLDADKFGAFRPMAYVQPYLLLVIPNLLFSGALFFGLAATTRKMLPNYVGGILLFMSYNIASLLVSADALTNSTVAALLDPFGFITLSQVTRYWTVAEQNAQLVPFEGLMLYNRLLWLGLGLALFGGLVARFQFAHRAGGGTTRSGADDEDTAALARTKASRLITRLDLPRITTSFDVSARVRQFVSMTRRAFAEIVRDVYFYAIVAAGVLFLVVGADQVGTRYGTTVEPVTRIVAGELSSQFALFMIILVAFYAGQLVWRERDLKVQQIHDALPVPTGLSMGAKFVALVGMMLVLQALVMVVGLGTQVVKGYSQFELGLYVTELFGVEMVSYLLFGVLALTTHAVVNQKYVGHFFIILYFVALGFLGQLGLEHPLYRYSSGTSMPYSDMNGYGHFVTRFLWMSLHWSLVAVAMALVARLAWARGEEASLRMRWRQVRHRFTRPVALGLAAAGVFMLGTGSYIVYNTNVLNTFRTSDEQTALTAQYEKNYGAYENTPQPRITAVTLDVGLDPDRRRAAMSARYTLVNKTEGAIDSVHVDYNAGMSAMRLDTIAFDRPAQTALSDDTLGFRIYALDAPLAPGDTMRMDLRQRIEPEGFTAGGMPANALAPNGTFINNSVLPAIGYQAGSELSDPDDRSEYDLPPKPRMPLQSDSLARRTPYIGGSADWIDFTTTVSTSPEQVALAPGRRVRSWTNNGRRHTRFEAQVPMLNFYTYLSARYDTREATWTPSQPDAPEPPAGRASTGGPVDITVRYHPAHTFNIDRMVEGVKASLDYYTQAFGPYQNDHIRIAEFPQYQGAFAQSFLGTIPFSESMGFILRLDEEEDIDFPFYVTAHEVAHQWWGHQVVGANVRGATVLSETLAQYSALMVMKETYGERQMRRFLEYELDRYLRGRSAEQRKELPLVETAGQSYIHYRKGANVMYALQDYVGEANVNRALRRLVEKEKFQGPPYPTSRSLVRELEAVTPDSMQYVIDDWFREITLYENRATEATYTPTDDGRYRVELTVDAQKVRADSLGSETDVEMNDYVDIGVFASSADVDAAEQEALYLKKHRLTSGEQTVTVTVNEEPAQAGIDPYLKLIDRDSDDNVTSVTAADT
jgi:hypothetical protein